VASSTRPRTALRWQSFEAWVGTRSSGVALFVLALAVFAVQSAVLPVYPGRDMGRYVQTFVQLPYDEIVLSSVMNTRGPLAALGVGVPLELGGGVAEVWLGALYAASILAWGYVALTLGARAALLTTGLLLVYPGYGILFHGLGGDSLFAALFAGWAVVLSRAMLRPSIKDFLAAGFGMGLLVLVRPSNQVLIVIALIPLLLSAPWDRRLKWVASFFVASVAVTQGWKALATLRYGDGVALKPSSGVLAVAGLLLLALAVPAAWRGRLALLAIPLAVGVVAVKGVDVQSPAQYARSLSQVPAGNPFVFRAFEIDPIMSPDNGAASRELGRVVQRELLTKEPYRSYGIDLEEFFSSGSDRMFEDLTNLSGVDLQTVTNEAIRRHPTAFATGIVQTIWHTVWTRRVYAPEPAPDGSSRAGGGARSADQGESAFVVVDGRRLPRPSEGQPIPASHFGPVVRTLGGQAHDVWQSPTKHPLVFDDQRDQRRWARFGRQTDRLASRIPMRDANQERVHRLNQTSHLFPPPAFWLAVGILGVAIRRPRSALAALAPSIAGLIVIVATSLVAFAVAEYAAPVSPAFILLTAVGLVGAHPRGRPRLPWRRSAGSDRLATNVGDE
jgi:Dolichyl-phosphate-mannose-protein mannosyltransferase